MKLTLASTHSFLQAHPPPAEGAPTNPPPRPAGARALRSAMDASALLSVAPFRGVLRLPSASAAALGTIVLAHGFGVPPRAYSALAGLWARDGWAVYVPSLYSVLVPPGGEVASLARACTFAHLNLPGPLLLAGHSRGGQAALLLLLRLMGGAFGDGCEDDFRDGVHAAARSSLGPCLVSDAPPLWAFRGLLLLDPVEGRPRRFGPGLHHLILGAAGLDWGWNGLPVLIIGAKRGADGLCPAAPRGHNYAAVYSALRAARPTDAASPEFGEMPFFLCEVSRFGHMDFLDDPSVSHGCVPALAWCFLPGEISLRGVLREYCRRVTRMVFGAGAKRDLAMQLARAKPG